MLNALFIGLTRLLTGALAQGKDFSFYPNSQRIFYANHSSHMDTLAIWTLIPAEQRARVRPAAAKDYWWSSTFKRYIAEKVFNAIPVLRNREDPTQDPLAELHLALDQGDSLIFFPEGTRGTGEDLQKFRSGLFHLAAKHPSVELVPVFIRNLNRVLPKGEFLPVPVFCSVTFGKPFQLDPEEEKQTFLERAQSNLLALADL